MELRREVLSYAQSTHALGYINDMYITSSYAAMNPNHNNQYNYQSTLAIGENIELAPGKYEETYRYPKAAFLGQKQVYPPIVDMEIGNVRGINSNDTTFNFDIGKKYAYIGVVDNCDKTYLFPNILWVNYRYGDQSRIRNPEYSNAYLPSFNPATQSTASQYAYIENGKIYIKDPSFPYYIPTANEQTFSTFSNNNIWEAHFKINETLGNQLKTAYQVTHYPIAYNKTSSNPQILRRQGVAGDGMNIDTVTTGSSWSSYYKLDFFVQSGESAPVKVTPQNDLIRIDVTNYFNYENKEGTLVPYGIAMPNNFSSFVNDKNEADVRIGGQTFLNVFFVKLPYPGSQLNFFKSDSFTQQVHLDNELITKRIASGTAVGSEYSINTDWGMVLGQQLDSTEFDRGCGLSTSLHYICDCTKGPFFVYGCSNSGETQPSLVLRLKEDNENLNYTIAYYNHTMIYSNLGAGTGDTYTEDLTTSSYLTYGHSTNHKEKFTSQITGNTSIWELPTTNNWVANWIDTANSGYTYFHVCADVLEVYSTKSGGNTQVIAKTNRVWMPKMLIAHKIYIDSPPLQFTTTIS